MLSLCYLTNGLIFIIIFLKIAFSFYLFLIICLSNLLIIDMQIKLIGDFNNLLGFSTKLPSRSTKSQSQAHLRKSSTKMFQNWFIYVNVQNLNKNNCPVAHLVQNDTKLLLCDFFNNNHVIRFSSLSFRNFLNKNQFHGKKFSEGAKNHFSVLNKWSPNF